MIESRRGEGEEGKEEELDSKDRGRAPPASFSQLGLNVWERLRSKSGLRGERPVAFTERDREREGKTCTVREVEGLKTETGGNV